MSTTTTSGGPSDERTWTTQEAIIHRGIGAQEDTFKYVRDELEDAGKAIRLRLNDMLERSTPTSLPALKTARAKMSALSTELDAASDELKAIIQEAEAHAPPALKCYACKEDAEYMAPETKKDGSIVWQPICKHHAQGWWDGADEIGRMFKIGEGVVEPTEG